MFLCSSVFASTLSYNSYEMQKTPLSLAQSLDEKFSEQGFHTLADNQHGIPSMGMNQVYFKNETQFVMVKYGVEGDFPLDEIIPTPKGFMVHRSANDQKYMIYFRGFSVEFVKVMLNRLNNNVSRTSLINNLFIPTAHAEECAEFGAPILNQSAELSSISAASAWESLKACMSGLGDGVYGSTVGVVTGVADELKAFFSHPIDYVEKVADKVEMFLVKTAKFIKGLIENPQETMNNVGRGLGKAWDDVKNTVSSMSTDMKINFVCSFLGAVGVDAAIAFFTGGAGSQKIILTINNLARKFGRLGKIIKLISKLGSGALSKLKLQGAKMEKFMKGLFNNKYPEADLEHLDELAGLSDELSLRTLSCYIR